MKRLPAKRRDFGADISSEPPPLNMPVGKPRLKMSKRPPRLVPPDEAMHRERAIEDALTDDDDDDECAN